MKPNITKKRVSKLEGITAAVLFLSVVVFLCYLFGVLVVVLPVALYIAIISSINLILTKISLKEWHNTKFEWIALGIMSVFALPIFVIDLYFGGFKGFKYLFIHKDVA